MVALTVLSESAYSSSRGVYNNRWDYMYGNPYWNNSNYYLYGNSYGYVLLSLDEPIMALHQLTRYYADNIAIVVF